MSNLIALVQRHERIRKVFRRKNWAIRIPHFKVTQYPRKNTDRSRNFLLVIRSNYTVGLFHAITEINGDFGRKKTNLFLPVYSRMVKKV